MLSPLFPAFLGWLALMLHGFGEYLPLLCPLLGKLSAWPRQPEILEPPEILGSRAGGDFENKPESPNSVARSQAKNGSNLRTRRLPSGVRRRGPKCQILCGVAPWPPVKEPGELNPSLPRSMPPTHVRYIQAAWPPPQKKIAVRHPPSLDAR